MCAEILLVCLVAQDPADKEGVGYGSLRCEEIVCLESPISLS